MVISKESMKYSLNNLKMRKSRSLLTILSIFVGISAIFIFVSFGWGLYDYVNEFTTEGSANKVLIQPKGTGAPGLDDTFGLTEIDIRAIKRVAGVYDVTGASFSVAEIQKGVEKRYVFVQSYDPKIPLIWDISNVGLFAGRSLQSGDTGKVTLGYNFYLDDKIFSKSLGLNDNFEMNGKKVKITGFMEAIGNPQDDSNIYVTQEFFDELYPEKIGKFGWVIAEVEIGEMNRIVDDIEKALRKTKGQKVGQEDFFVQSFEEMIESFSGALDIIIGFVILIALISVTVSAVNTANTMITSVIERTKEIGVIKSIGARNSEILKIFLFESAFLGFVAGVVGVLVGWLFTSVAESVLEGLGWGFLSPHYSISLFIGCILFSTLTGAISGIVPAIRASRINAVDALRYE
ncbi:MAG: ABC transporter permease [Nanoarchaeota archaeon]|nr:ABC transporter permease [Nanoarchaeota archaeon]